MPNLTELQHNFQHYLITSDESQIQSSIVSDQISSDCRLKIYFDAYRLRLLDILSADFSKTMTLLGEEVFRLAFEKYLDQYPSTHFSVRYFGRYFSDFLRESPDHKSLPVVAEMAAFEYALMNAIDAADDEVASIEDLKAIPPENWGAIQLTFHPSLQYQVCEWNTPVLWKAIDDEADPIPPQKNPEAMTWIIWRKGIRNLFQSLTPQQYQLLHAFKNNLCFGEVLEGLSTEHNIEDLPTFALQNIQHWLQSNLISHVTF